MVFGILMLIVDLFIMYEITNIFFYSKNALCKEAVFIDTVNLGRG